MSLNDNETNRLAELRAKNQRSDAENAELAALVKKQQQPA